MIDSGVDYSLEPANPPSIEVAGEIRYGSSDAVPSRLDEPEIGLATVVFLASADDAANRRSLAALDETNPIGTDIVAVVDGVDPGGISGHEVVRTSAPLGRGASLNIGIRRAGAPVVVVIDPTTVPSGDVVTPLVEALRDPTVAVVGPFGLASRDMQRFDEVDARSAPVDVTAIEGDLIAFRRADAAARGPIDEGFRFYRYLDVWLSLVLRDQGDGRDPRRAVVLPGLPLERADRGARMLAPVADRDRLSKRNWYRVLDRFRTRLDLAVPAAVVRSGTDS